MTAQTHLQPLDVSDQPLVENLWQCYMHDLSEFRGSLPGPDGRYKNSRVAKYLTAPDHSAFLIKVDEAPAGFVMIREHDENGRVLGELFVVRPLRRQGLGRTVAIDVVRSHPGRWELAFQETNQLAVRFWTAIATQVAGDDWTVAPRHAPVRPDSPPDLWLSFKV